MAEHDNFDDEKLVSSSTTQRNWRGILIALLVIVVVLALIVTSVVLLTPPEEGPRVKGVRLSLEDILGHDFQPLKFNGTWISDEELVFKDEWGGISIMNVTGLSTRVIMTNQTYMRLNPSRFQLSADQRYLLLAQNIQKLFRHSHLAQYTIYDIHTGVDFPLRPLPESSEHPFLLFAEWTPRGNGIIMVQDYDVYYRKSPTSHTGYRITDTAVPGVVSHGVPDWLYEEEVLGTNKAIWMSSDGLLLLFASFNDTLVEEVRFPWYGSITEGQLYPEIRSLRYPRPGTRNPEVSLTVADLADTSNIKTKTVYPPSYFANSEYYFTAISWVSLTEISVTWLNRVQNVSLITVCTNPKWDCKEVQRISSNGHGWVDMNDNPVFSPDGTNYITVAPVKDGSAGYFRHAVAVNIPKKRIIPLTHGKYEVTRILTWDHSNDVIYYLGIPEGKPGQQHLYRVTSVPPRTGSTSHPPACLTCVLEPTPTSTIYTALNEDTYLLKIRHWDDDDDTVIHTTTPPPKRRKTRKQKAPNVTQPCLYHNAVFSPRSTYFVLECLGPGVPTNFIYKSAMPKPKLLGTLQNNTLLRQNVAKIAMPQIKTFPIQISGGHTAYVRLHLPPGLKEDEITKYPLIVQVYGSPGSQLVTERWKVDWNTYLSSNKDFIIAQIDGRGSGGQGHKLLHEVYRRLGSVEVSDQLEVTEYLRDTLHFIDKRRLAVWGWSYGGFVAALALANPRSVFKCAISIAPVTNWRFYAEAYVNMIHAYGAAGGNGLRAQAEYRNLFPNRQRYPDRRTIENTYRIMRETGSIPRQPVGYAGRVSRNGEDILENELPTLPSNQHSKMTSDECHTYIQERNDQISAQFPYISPGYSLFSCSAAIKILEGYGCLDSAYTERYMGWPNVTDNYKGYEEADVGKKAHLLKNRMFYLLHGAADDNVHLQQSMALAKALSMEGVLFRQQIYPDETHGLGGVKKHLYTSMEQFLDDCFKKQVIPEFKAGLRSDGE